MSSVHALEAALGVEVNGELRKLRRLLYCGEWIESHALHVHLLHAPDFLGYDGAVDGAGTCRRHRARGLRLKKHGNQLLDVLGGRAVHPINVAVGGFHRLPRRAELARLVPDFEWGLEAAIEATRWAASFNFPAWEQSYDFVALSHPEEYAMCVGEIRTTDGLSIRVAEFEEHFHEQQVPHSTALQSLRTDTGRSYFVGPLARLNLNREQLLPVARRLADEVGFEQPCRNVFKSIVARCLEIVQAYEESLSILRDYRGKDGAEYLTSARRQAARRLPRQPGGCFTIATLSTTTASLRRPISSPPLRRTRRASRTTCAITCLASCRFPTRRSRKPVNTWYVPTTRALVARHISSRSTGSEYKWATPLYSSALAVRTAMMPWAGSWRARGRRTVGKPGRRFRRALCTHPVGIAKLARRNRDSGYLRCRRRHSSGATDPLLAMASGGNRDQRFSRQPWPLAFRGAASRRAARSITPLRANLGRRDRILASRSRRSRPVQPRPRRRPLTKFVECWAMHETSLIRTLIAQVGELLADHDRSALRRVRIQIGPLSCVEPALLVSAWEQQCGSGAFPAATLEIDEVPLVACCDTCTAHFKPVHFQFRCPNCGSVETKVVSGDGVVLHSLEIDDAKQGSPR